MRNVLYTNSIYLILLIVFGAFPFVANAEISVSSYTRSPSGSSITSPVNIQGTVTASTENFFRIFLYDNNANNPSPTHAVGPCFEIASIPGSFDTNINATVGFGFTHVEIHSHATLIDCQNDTSANLLVDYGLFEGDLNYEDLNNIFVIVEGGGGGAEAMAFIEQASDDFGEAYGFTIDELTDWTGGKILLVAGSGLALFDALLPFILGLALIAGIVYIVYRAFLLFRH